MKNKIAIFCVIVFAFFSIVGCSKNEISNAEIVEDTIKTEYIVGETVEINQFKLKLTRNKKEEIYDITEDMITVSEIDNTIKGNQKIDINVKYDGKQIKVSVGLEFKLPDKVAGVITLIDELPDPENVNFSNEEQIDTIDKSINTLSEFYKGYIENIDKLEACKEKLNHLYDTYITPEFLNDRFILKTNLDNLFYSLKENDYSKENWDNIVRIYDSSIANLYLNQNHNIIKVIVNGAIIQIYNIKTVDQQTAEVLRVERVKDLVGYRNLFSVDDYSNDNLLILDNIEREYISKLNSANSCELVDILFNEALEKMDSVVTLEEEREQAFLLIKETKIEEVKTIRLNIDLSVYSNENRNLIADYYNLCLENIRKLSTVDEIDNEIIKFKNKISLIKTIEEEERELLYNTKRQISQEINDFYNNINIYEYDSQNRIIIQNLVNNAIDSVDYASTVIEVTEIRKILIEEVDKVPTMIEQAQVNLVVVISEAKQELDEYVSTLNSSDYTSDNWNSIKSIVIAAKNKLDTEVNISTHTIVIDEIVQKAKIDIDGVNTILEEEQIYLENVKTSSINRLEEYLNSLSENDFESASIFEISQARIYNAIESIRISTDVQTINRLTEDTISSIEDAKK